MNLDLVFASMHVCVVKLTSEESNDFYKRGAIATGNSKPSWTNKLIGQRLV
jgi:hypothetical protein